jgi:cyclophilin family peptidyl-prolyl cis-trans isomerase
MATSKVEFVFVIDPASHAAAVARHAQTVKLFDAVRSQAGLGGKSLADLTEDERQLVADLRCAAPGFENAELEFVAPVARGGRVVFELFDSVAPKACKNFLSLAKGDVVLRERRLCYEGSPVHRVVRGQLLQAGDFVAGDGSKGLSTFAKGAPFADERAGLSLPHLAGSLSMANAGKNTNTSQFFVCVTALPQLDGKHVVFGKVTEGLAVIAEICALGSAADGPPSLPVVVQSCRVVS